jgi:hypothetical protein
MRVVDLSSNQTMTSPAAFNAGVDAAYLRVRRSNGLFDSKWRAFHDAITVPRAPYIFIRSPADESYTSQFTSFWNTAKTVPWEWGPVIDAEFAGLTAANVRSAITACRAATGRDLVYVYIGHADLVGGIPFSSFATDSNVRVIGSRYFQNNFGTAFADFGLDDPHLDIVQYWDAVSCPGISAPCDNNNARRLIKTGDNQLTSALTPEEHNWLSGIWQATFTGSHDAAGTYDPMVHTLATVQSIVTENQVRINAVPTNAELASALTTALAGVGTVTVDVNTLAANLAPALAPLLNASTLDAAEVAQIVADAIKSAAQKIVAS